MTDLGLITACSLAAFYFALQLLPQGHFSSHTQIYGPTFPKCLSSTSSNGVRFICAIIMVTNLTHTKLDFGEYQEVRRLPL